MTKQDICHFIPLYGKTQIIVWYIYIFFTGLALTSVNMLFFGGGLSQKKTWFLYTLTDQISTKQLNQIIDVVIWVSGDN